MEDYFDTVIAQLTEGDVVYTTSRGTDYFFRELKKNRSGDDCIRYGINGNLKSLSRALLNCYARYIEVVGMIPPTKQAFIAWCQKECNCNCEHELKFAPCNFSVMRSFTGMTTSAITINLRPGSLQNNRYKLNIPVSHREAVQSAFADQSIVLILNHQRVIEIPNTNPTYRNHNAFAHSEITEWLQEINAIPYPKGNPPSLAFSLLNTSNGNALAYTTTGK